MRVPLYGLASAIESGRNDAVTRTAAKATTKDSGRMKHGRRRRCSDRGTIGTGEGCATTFREGRETAVECARRHARRGGATRPHTLVRKFPFERGRVTPYRLVYAATLSRVHTALTATATAVERVRREPTASVGWL